MFILFTLRWETKLSLWISRDLIVYINVLTVANNVVLTAVVEVVVVVVVVLVVDGGEEVSGRGQELSSPSV